MAEQARTHDEHQVIAGQLRGDRSLHQRDKLRPKCAHCGITLRPGAVLMGWDVDARRQTCRCTTCDGVMSLVDDPEELVDALRILWTTRQRHQQLVDQDADPIRVYGARAAHRAAERRCRELHVDVPNCA